VKCFIAAILFVMTMSASALSVSEYNNARNDKLNWARVKAYLGGVGEGVSFASTALIYQRREPLYCLPDETVLETEDYIKAIDLFIEKNPVYPELKIESILVKSLIAAFPCAP
jgi:hypothetical protein